MQPVKTGAVLLSVAIASFLVYSCAGPSNPKQQVTRSFEEIKASGSLVVLTRNASSTVYVGRDGELTGPEFDMLKAFATSHGLELEIIYKDSIQAIIEGIENAEADLAAAGLSVTEQREDRFRFGPGYQDVTQQVVCRRDNVQPDEIADLVGLDIVVPAGSSYSEQLNRLKEDYTGLEWKEGGEGATEKLLYSVWQREIDCTIADSNIVDINRRYFPELIAPLNLRRSEQLAWMMSADRKDLQEAVEEWFEAFEESGRLAALLEHYYGFFKVFDYVDIKKLIRRIDQRFPKYRGLFKGAAEKYDLPFLLLAAQGYQESHWQSNAESPTGVRGIMMLTRETAKAMGVSNRLDPRQSIYGGAKYLSQLHSSRFSEKVKEPDRTWLALAAYNIGRGHIHDAQSLAREQGLNPHLWVDVKQVLPLLAQKRHYRNLKYGYARGTEPVRYVQRIREYQHVIENELDR